MKNKPKLIILYGRFQTDLNVKQQRMILGKSTCMYREYAKEFGEIIYLAPQNCYKSWESSITDPHNLLSYLRNYTDAAIWSVKHDPNKDLILKALPNKKIYYSCCAYNIYNKYCDLSLVDTHDRVKGNGFLWFKGKNPDYWLPSENKIYDILIIGARGDKNELFFLNEMNKSQKKYKILWIGGEKFRDRIKSKHEVTYTHFLSMDEVRKAIPLCKIGIMLSEHPAEGFPQSFLEMTMCGVPVIFLKHRQEQKIYMDNALIINNKKKICEKVDFCLEKIQNKSYTNNERNYAVRNYSLEKSYGYILEALCLRT